MRVTRHLPAVAALIGILTLPMATAEAQDTAATVDSSRPQQAGSDTLGQDSTRLGASGDSAAVQNPPGYRGMERDTTVFPPADDSAAAAADADATNRANQRARQDKLKEKKNQNPPGYRGMERPAGQDTAAVQNPPGYRGMERDTTLFPPTDDSAAADADATNRTNQRARQDSLGQTGDQNPPGYRGMERPAALDSAGASDTSATVRDTAATESGKADTTPPETE